MTQIIPAFTPMLIRRQNNILSKFEGLERPKFWYGAGIEGLLCRQFPATVEAQTYIAGEELGEELCPRYKSESHESMYEDDDLMMLIDSILTEVESSFDTQNIERMLKFGTENIKEHDNLVHHQFNNSRLVLLENLDEEEFYVTFETSDEYESCNHKTFPSLDEAESYIRSFIDIQNVESLQDVAISCAIYRDLEFV